MPTLDAHKQLVSDLWLDQPDAHERIDARADLAPAEATALHRFVDDGYLTVTLPLDEAFADAFEADVQRQWVERPVDLAAAPGAGGRMSFRDLPDRVRTYRIADLQSHSSAALDLYLRPEIFRMVELVFAQRAIAFQSLYFRYGSEQSLHRDPMFVSTKPASHLLAAWIALEDIGPDCGPLLYVPGSHRMPWHEFTDDDIAMGADKPAGAREEYNAHRDRTMAEMGLEARAFTGRRGDVFLWHGSLLHGGAPRADERLTRKSFVVHYSTAANYRSRRASMRMKVRKDGAEVVTTVSGSTERVVERDGRLGLDNPLRGVTEPS